MATTRDDIRHWFDRGVTLGHTHLVVWCDTYDWEDYPEFYTGTAEEIRSKVSELNGTNMRKHMETYNLSMDREAQLNQHRAHNY